MSKYKIGQEYLFEENHPITHSLSGDEGVIFKGSTGIIRKR